MEGIPQEGLTEELDAGRGFEHILKLIGDGSGLDEDKAVEGVVDTLMKLKEGLSSADFAQLIPELETAVIKMSATERKRWEEGIDKFTEGLTAE